APPSAATVEGGGSVGRGAPARGGAVVRGGLGLLRVCPPPHPGAAARVKVEEESKNMPPRIPDETYASQGPNPYVFIVGCMRSGTTLLQRIVDAHPRMAIIHELWWLEKWYKDRIGLTPEGLVTPELVSRLQAFPKFTRKVPIGREDLEGLLRSGRPVSFASFMSGVFDWYGKSQGKPLAGDKTPENVRKIRTLHKLWPNARFVHVIRDGRDVALSVRNWKEPVKLLRRSPTWDEDPVTTLALWWEWHVQ